VVRDSKVEFSELGDSESLRANKEPYVVGMIIGGVVHVVVNDRQSLWPSGFCSGWRRIWGLKRSLGSPS